MQRPQRGGYANQRLGEWEGYGFHEIGDGNPIFYAGVPDTRRQTCFGRGVHACVVARGIAGTRADLQQEWRSPHDDAKDEGRSEVLHGADVFELGYTES